MFSSRVDQYGFEKRNCTLPSGNALDGDADVILSNWEKIDGFTARYYRVLTRRAMRWHQKTVEGQILPAKNLLKRFIRKGVPSDRRALVWMTVSGAAHIRHVSTKSYAEIVEGLQTSENVRTALTESIKIDLPRTFPNNIHFNHVETGLRQSLYSILKVFAEQNRTIGYCQGLNFIGGLLLLVVKNEEASFWLLKTLVEEILPEYYVANMRGLLIDLDVLDDLVHQMDRRLYRHCQDLGLHWSMATTKWFVCIYVEVLPTETVLRIWDCLFYEGTKILFWVALALLRLHRRQILASVDLEQLLHCFRRMGQHEKVIDCHNFILNEIMQHSKQCSDEALLKLRRKYSQPQL